MYVTGFNSKGKEFRKKVEWEALDLISIWTVLVKLSFSLLAFSQLIRLSKTTSMSYTLQLIAVKLVSSAKSSTSTDGQDRGRSLIYIRN